MKMNFLAEDVTLTTVSGNDPATAQITFSLRAVSLMAYSHLINIGISPLIVSERNTAG